MNGRIRGKPKSSKNNQLQNVIIPAFGIDIPSILSKVCKPGHPKAAPDSRNSLVKPKSGVKLLSADTADHEFHLQKLLSC